MSNLNKFLQSDSIASDLKDDDLTKIGKRVVEDYDIDLKSRQDAGWDDNLRTINKLARQVMNAKEGESGEIVSNIKYPCIPTAVIQFHARAYPAVIKGREVCKCAVVGQDPNGWKSSRGRRVSSAMNYQLLELMDAWPEDFDKCLFIIPMVGGVFKKTYFDPICKKVKSPYILSEDCVVNYWARSLESAGRVTHVCEYRPNEIEEMVRGGVWIKHDYKGSEGDTEKYDTSDEDRPHIYLEQHRWWDLDGDGYQEPWIVTVHKETEAVVAIAPRFTESDVYVNDKGEISKINAIEYFTYYPFMPSMDRPEEGSGVPFYGMGFGYLLSPINRVINSTLNMLMDAGAMKNNGGGFISSNVKIGKAGSVYFQRNEWKRVNHRGPKLADNIVPLPVQEPSMVLFQLLGAMIEAGKELASMSDVLAGQNPGRDVPATTTMALIEQGLKVFSAVYKRIHQSLKSELKKVRRLNSIYMQDEEYLRIIDVDPQEIIGKTSIGQDIMLGEADPNDPQIICTNEFSAQDHDIIPVSDEADLTDVQRLVKAEALMQLQGRGLPDQDIMRRYLEALRIPDIDKLLAQYQPPPDPKMVIEQGRMQMEQAKLAQEKDLKTKELQVKAIEAIASAVKDYAGAAKLYKDADTEETTEGTTEDGKPKKATKTGKVDKYVDLVDELVGMLRAYNREMGIGNEGNEGDVRPMVGPPDGGMVPAPDAGAQAPIQDFGQAAGLS